MSYLLTSAHAGLSVDRGEEEIAGEGVVEWSMTGIDQRVWCAGPEAGRGGHQPTTPLLAQHNTQDRNDLLFSTRAGRGQDFMYTFKYEEREKERDCSCLFLSSVFLFLSLL